MHWGEWLPEKGRENETKSKRRLHTKGQMREPSQALTMIISRRERGRERERAKNKRIQKREDTSGRGGCCSAGDQGKGARKIGKA